MQLLMGHLIKSNMGPYEPKPFELLWNPTRWTIGVAWEYYEAQDYVVTECNQPWQLEISIQIPMVALSVLIKGNENKTK